VDKDGNPCPTADCPVTFNVLGAGEFAAADNGDPTSTESFHSPTRKAFSGKCMLIVRSLRDQTGEITIEAVSAGLSGATVTLQSLSV
jgi:beta-galactosidase